MRRWYVYIMASSSRVLYVGVTGDLERRVHEHKEGSVSGFTSKYRVTRLVYYEAFDRPSAAIEAEKRIKGWTRAKKITLIETMNPEWNDLAASFALETPDEP